MHKKTMKKRLGGFTVSAMACGIALLGSAPAFALSVGEPLVRSRLGQPLDAWIPVVLESPEEKEALDSFAASLAAANVYLARALEVPAVGALQLRALTTDGQVRLHLTSQQPFVEPMSTLLIKVSLGRVSILRELPLLLDLPASAAAAEPLPVAPEAALPAAAAIAVQPAVVEIKTPVRDKPRSQAPPKIADVPAPASAPAPVPIRRFQLDERFSSYQQLAAAGQAPQPASAQVLPPPATEPQTAVAAVATAAPTRLEELPSAPSRPADSGNGVLWVLTLAFALAIAISNARVKSALVAWFSRLKAMLLARLNKSAPESVQAAQPLPARPSQKASKGAEFNVRSDDLVPEAHALSALTKAKSVAAPAEGISAERQRLQQLQKQFSSEEARQKLKLAEAYIDLNRMPAATRLMDEVERLKQSVADRRLALVKR